MAKTLDKMTRDVQETERELAKVLAKTSDLVERRIKAVEKQTGQKIDKMKEAGKELAKGVLGEAHKLFFSTISDAEAVAGEYYGKLTKLEAKRAEMYKRIVEFTDNFPSTPGIAGDEIKKTLHAMHRKFQALQLQYESFDRDLDKRLEKGKRARAGERGPGVRQGSRVGEEGRLPRRHCGRPFQRREPRLVRRHRQGVAGRRLLRSRRDRLSALAPGFFPRHRQGVPAQASA